MALKAGRVGVSPDQVDEFGKISSDATGAYTKQEADAKFETQSHASSTYETKTEAAALQPKTLAVPISMLDGSKLTVESALQGLNTEKISKNIESVSMTFLDTENEYFSGENSCMAILLNGHLVITLVLTIIKSTSGDYIDVFDIPFKLPQGFTVNGIAPQWTNLTTSNFYNYQIVRKNDTTVTLKIRAGFTGSNGILNTIVL